MELVIVLSVIVVLAIGTVAIALCKAASVADKILEDLEK